MKQINGLVIINDIRAVPLISSLKIYRNVPDLEIIAHESLFLNREFADFTNISWKYFIKYFLKFFFNLKILKAKCTEISDNETMGIFSSLYSITQDTSATEDKYPQIFSQLKNLALGSKDIVNYLKNNKIHKVFLFNGRTASSYLITKYCTHNKVKIFYYEYAGNRNGFRLYPLPPHAAGRIGEYLLNYYKNGVYNKVKLKESADIMKLEKLNSIYKKKANIVSENRYDIVIFLGSDFEYKSVDVEISELNWKGNLSFCQEVIQKYGINRKYTIRCHPNSEIDPNWNELYKELCDGLDKFKSIVEIIPPDSRIDSHKMIENSNLSISDLSTISLDAILLGKKVDIFGNTDIKHIYEDEWFNTRIKNNSNNYILNPFALTHNFFVFRFSFLEKYICYLLFLIHHSFTKINTIKWKIFYKK